MIILKWFKYCIYIQYDILWSILHRVIVTKDIGFLNLLNGFVFEVSWCCKCLFDDMYMYQGLGSQWTYSGLFTWSNNASRVQSATHNQNAISCHTLHSCKKPQMKKYAQIKTSNFHSKSIIFSKDFKIFNVNAIWHNEPNDHCVKRYSINQTDSLQIFTKQFCAIIIIRFSSRIPVLTEQLFFICTDFFVYYWSPIVDQLREKIQRSRKV